jgi:hypothetical protein
MEPRTLSRFISAAFFAIIAGVSSHRFTQTQNEMGKEAFLAKQELRFDRFYAQPAGKAEYWAVVFTVGLVGAYELLALGIYQLVKPKQDRA